MGWLSGVVVFVLAWWLIFFMTLPFGVRRRDAVEPGHDPGAPERPRLWAKAAATTLIALAVTGLILLAVESDLVSFREARVSYCEAAPGHEWHGPYHDREYGFPTEDDAALFERLVLEINQAGLSWLTVLKKRDAFRAAFRGFDPDVVAAFDDRDRERLLADAGIIRNRLKVDAAIENARRVVEIRREHGSLAAWIEAGHPRDRDAWVALFRKTFRFMGPEIVGEFLMSTGHLPGAHRPDCPVHAVILRLDPPWMRHYGPG